MADVLTSLRARPSFLAALRAWRAQPVPASGPAPLPLFDDIRGEFLTAAVVDREFGAVLTPGGKDSHVMKAEALANADVVDTAAQVALWLGEEDEVMEIQITTRTQVQVVRPYDSAGSMYLYVAFDKEKGKYFDLAQMRVKMIELAFGL